MATCLSALHLALRLFVALLFARAATHKLRHPIVFRAIVANYRVLPPRLAASVAALVPVAEGIVAVALLAAPARRAGELGAAFLLALYAATIAVNLHRGRSYIDCGCGDPRAGQPLNRVLVARNTALALLLGLGALSSATAPPLALVFTAGAAALCAFLLYLGHEQLLGLSLRPRPGLSPALRRLAWGSAKGEAT